MSVARFQTESAGAAPVDRSRDKPIETPLSLERRTKLREELLAETPSWYVPLVHLLGPSSVGIVAIVYALSLLRNVTPWELLVVPGVYLFANAFEWWIHGAALHRRNPLAPVLYDQHTPKHHMLYLTEDMAIRDNREYRLVLIPGYGLMMIFVGQLAVSSALWWLGFHNIACLYVATAIGYAVSYEWLHFSYHLPHEHPVARNPIIQKLARHHAIHHDPRVMQRWNMNVTVPLTDYVMGTAIDAPPRADHVLRALIVAFALASASTALAAGAGSCIGVDACLEDAGKIGKKSCIGNQACPQNLNKIGDESCIEAASCVRNLGKIGKRSCIGQESCNNNNGSKIGTGSCIGNQACAAAGGKIGNGSCFGFEACEANEGKIGNLACSNEESCTQNSGTIGNGACWGEDACGSNLAAVGKGACLGNSSCRGNAGSIADGACVGGSACFFNATTIGKASCRGISACMENTASIGKGSCLGNSACRGNQGVIGDGACIGDNACFGNLTNRASGECIGAGSCAVPP